jgi:hypothetical protein
VQFEREVADPGAELQLDEMMNVLGVGIVAHPRGTAGSGVEKLAPNSVETQANGGHLRFSQDICAAQCERVGLTGDQLLFEQLPVESQRTLPVVKSWV